jgi:membrane protease YdiL (CAAX protease family)
VLAWILFNTFLVGLSEELMFRGVLLQRIRRTVSIWPAVWLTTLAFSAIHILNVFMTGDLRTAVIQAAAAALSGLLFIALRLRTGSLWTGIVVHGLWDFATFTISASRSVDAQAVSSGGPMTSALKTIAIAAVARAFAPTATRVQAGASPPAAAARIRPTPPPYRAGQRHPVRRRPGCRSPHPETRR